MANENEDLSYLNNMNGDNDATESEDENVVEQPKTEEPSEEPEEEEVDGEEEEQEDDAPAKTDSGEVEVQPRRRSETRVQKLANERTQEREARIRAEAERDALLKFRPPAPAQDNEALRLRQQKLDLMEPAERTLFLQSEQIEQMRQQMLLGELRSEDRADKAAFDAKAMLDPRYARHKDDVEKELRDLRSKGVNASREQILAQVIGRKLLGEKPRKAARTAAQARVASVQGKPVNARSTQVASAGKGNDLSDLEARLRGKSFNEMFQN